MEYQTCRTDEGGKPKCGLGCISENLSIEVRGASFDTVYEAQNDPFYSRNGGLEIDREYDVMIILEAPGFYEDKKGTPTVGKTGDKLSNFILKAGFDTSKVYITNAVKCRPPKNRKPSVKEVTVCSDHLDYEIRRINPKVVMLLGNSALKSFNLHNQGGIFKIKGEVFKKQFPGWKDGPEFTVIPSFHPAFFLHRQDPQVEKRTLDHYILAANISKGLPPRKYKKTPFKVIRNIEQVRWLVDQIKESGTCAFDTESRSKEWWREPLICFSFSWGENQAAVLPVYNHTQVTNSLGWNLTPFWGTRKDRPPFKVIANILKEEIFENPNIRKAAHNLKYDWLVLRKWVGSELKGDLFDTMILHHILNEKRPHDLEYLADIETGCGDYSSRKNDIVGRGKELRQYFDMVPDHLLWPYASMDALNVYKLLCIYTFRLFCKLEENNGKVYKLYVDRLMPLIEVLMESEWNGIRIDTDKLDKVLKEYEGDQEKLVADLRSKVGNPEFNPGSNDEVRDEIIKAGLSDSIKDSANVSGYSVSKDKLKEITDKWDLAEDILNYRNNVKIISTYLKRAVKDVCDDGKIRKSFLIHGTDSGRLSCSFLHQIPRNDPKKRYNIRDLFIADPGYEFAYLDYSQIELKVYAVLVYIFTGDDKFMKVCLDPNIDVHKRTAQLILGLEHINDFNRQVGKTQNFGIAYGSMGYSLVKEFYEDENGKKRLITWDMVGRGLSNFHNEYPALNEYANLLADVTRANGGVFQNVFGREIHVSIDELNSRPYTRAAVERFILNFSVQSVAGQIMEDTLIILHQNVKEWISNGRLQPDSIRTVVNTVHDSLMTEYKQRLRDWILPVLKRISERPIPELDNISFTVDIGVGRSWTDAENASKGK